jgi:hypothetical protein
MNAQMEMPSEDVLRIKLEVLRQEHRDLDTAIEALTDSPFDRLTLAASEKTKTRPERSHRATRRSHHP